MKLYLVILITFNTGGKVMKMIVFIITGNSRGILYILTFELTDLL